MQLFLKRLESLVISEDDGIRPIMLNITATFIAKPVTRLFNKSLHSFVGKCDEKLIF